MVTIDENTLRTAVINAQNFAQVMRNMKRADSSAGRKILKKHITKYDIDISHFETTKERYKRVLKPILEKSKIPSSLIFVENSDYHLSGTSLKKRLYNEGIKKRECEKCGQGEIWLGEKISLILDHINGVHRDNKLINLRILCPNCNSALPTHCKGAKGIKKIEEKIKKIKIKKEKKIRNRHLLSLVQRKVKRPEYNQLQNEIQEYGYSGVGRKYGVSDNAIRKWKKYYEKQTLGSSSGCVS